MMRMKKLTVLLCLGFAFPAYSTEADSWLPPSKGFFHAERIDPSLYLDLGGDAESLERLATSFFVLDQPEVVKSRSLTCNAPYKKYLIRSYLLDEPGARVFQAPDRLIVSVMAFSNPRRPDKGAIAICLLKDPESVEGNASFLK